MTFALPVALLGLASLPIILALHLLRERSRLIAISSLQLWSWLEIEVRGPRPRRVPLTWLLALHLTIAALLSMALAQPLVRLPWPSAMGVNQIILLDVSLSMAAQDVTPSRFSQARAEAAAILSSLDERDAAAVILLGSRANWFGSTEANGTGDLVARLATLSPHDSSVDLIGALTLANAAISANHLDRITLLTDAAFDVPDAGQLPELLAESEWRVFGAGNENQAIVALEARTLPAGDTQIFARVVSFGDEPAERVVALLADGLSLDSNALKLPPEATITQSWIVPPGVRHVEVRLAGTDVLPQDDRASIGLTVPAGWRAALVTATPDPLRRALESIAGISLDIVSPSDYRLVDQYDLTVFQNFLPTGVDAWPRGAVLIFDPSVTSASRLLEVSDPRPVDAPAISLGVPWLEEVDFTGVKWGNAFQVISPDWLEPALIAGHLPLLLGGETGDTRLVVAAFDLASGNLAHRPAFPVLLASLVSDLLANPFPPAIVLGETIIFPPKERFPSINVTFPDGEINRFGPEREASLDRTRSPGLYQIEAVDADGRVSTAYVGVNAGSLIESDLRARPLPKLITLDKSSGAGATGEAENGDFELWPVLAGLAILLLLIEAAFAWR